jgi:DNA polymerase alpha subunit A
VKKDNTYISCCITLTNLTHKIFFVPKEGAKEQQIYGDIFKLMKKHAIKDWSFRAIEKEYAFDNPLIKKGTMEVYEVHYSTKYLKLSDSKFSSEHIVCVVGSQVSLLENFLLEKKIMGPSWLNVQNFSQVSQKQKVSWCNFELLVNEQENIELSSLKMETPRLTVLSLNVKTQFLESQQINEIISISGIVSKDVNVETVESLNKVRTTFRSFSVIRKLPQTAFPDQIKKIATSKSKKIEFVEDEKVLLNYILSKIHSIDPDVIVGHNILGFDLDVLLHRMQKLKVSNWSKLGRLIRTEFPRLQKGAGGIGNSHFEEKSVLAGRLPCDTYINSRELVRLKNYTLGHLSETQLSIKRYDLDDEDVSIFYSSSEKFLKFIEHAENDCYISLCLLYKLEMLPLTKQLTSLAGNLWSSTLQGGRAQRIEFLLLHEFHNRGFLLPDKKIDIKNKEEKKKNKPSYKGGLVLDPQVGFYDKIVLLLDFNSLYPSIIQEYNICYTTGARNQDSEGKWVPSSIPDPTMNRGILPQVIKTLVDRRRQVKTELSKTKDPEKIQQLDIKQKAFKLTANSLYGCLGYKFSRFYAMPLAELVTRCGRETLQKTVNLANNNLNLRVIYGKFFFFFLDLFLFCI